MGGGATRAATSPFRRAPRPRPAVGAGPERRPSVSKPSHVASKPPSAIPSSAVIPSTLPEWSTTREFADWLGIEVAAVYWLNATGTGPRRHRIGKELRFRRRDIEEWLATRCVEPA